MTWDAIFSLQGHGPYILGAYGVTAVLMGVEVMLLWRRARVRRDRRAGADRPDEDRP
jgi:heme exporter protein CcmD